MSALSELREKVERATGPDRELDLALHLALFPDGEIAKLQSFRRGFDGEPGMSWDISGVSVCFQKYTDDGRCTYNGGYPLPALTASIDAALALVELKLPGQGWSLLEDALYLDRMSVKGPITKDLPRIVLIVLLRALESQEQDGG